MLIRYFAGAAEAAEVHSTHVDASGLDAGALVQMLGRENPALEQVLHQREQARWLSPSRLSGQLARYLPELGALGGQLSRLCRGDGRQIC